MRKKGRLTFYSSREEAKQHATLLGFTPTKVQKDLTGKTFGFMKVLFSVGKKSLGGHTHYVCVCLRCNSGEFVIQKGSAINGDRRTCGCSLIEDDITETRLNILGWEVLGRGDRTTKTRWRLLCQQGHEKLIFPSNILHTGYGCSSCNGTHGFRKQDPANFCIQQLVSDRQKFLKFGITNKDPSERLKQQARKSKFNHEVIYTLHSESGEDIALLEAEVKKRIPTKVVPKELLPDGYTETTNTTNLGTIFMIINEFFPQTKEGGLK